MNVDFQYSLLLASHLRLEIYIFKLKKKNKEIELVYSDERKKMSVVDVVIVNQASRKE